MIFAFYKEQINQMKTYNYLFFILIVSLVSFTPTSKNNNSGRNNRNIRSSIDTKGILLDTSLVFDNFPSFQEYRTKIKANLLRYTNEAAQKIPDAKHKKFFVDSLDHCNAELEKVLVFKMLKKMPKTVASLVTLRNFLVPAMFIPVEEELTFFNAFPTNAKNSKEGKNALARMKKFVTGAGYKIDDDHILDNTLLRSMKDKVMTAKKIITPPGYEYCLLIFGASWCSPCRFENKLLTKMIGQIDTTKVKIIGLSIDLSEDAWKNAVLQDNCPWECFLLEGGPASSFFKENGTASGTIPLNILIKNDGTIVKKHTAVKVALEALPASLYKKF
ncbi:MAG: hypothetical protein JWQ30_2311 [Sediminibacterium sp.]|nr:hypothetical protein [Sediminibacterium sp.]